jgi:hypothetical protein
MCVNSFPAELMLKYVRYGLDIILCPIEMDLRFGKSTIANAMFKYKNIILQ